MSILILIEGNKGLNLIKNELESRNKMIIEKIYNTYQQLKGGRLVEGIFNIGEYEQEREKKIQVPPEEQFFANVIGYSDIKKLLLMSLYNKEPLHILLTGPPASSKTVFMLEIDRNMKNLFFADGTAMSGSGIIDYLFVNPGLKFLLLDEIDKLDRRSQTVLLNLMETGILVETRARSGKGQRSQKMNLKIFGTSNESEKLIKLLKSRFIELQLDTYTWKEFREIAIKLLGQRYGTTQDVAEKIAYEVWYNLKTKDVRDVVQIGKLATKLETVHFVAASNDKLANLTGGKDTDFGGSFDHYICKFEEGYNGFGGLVVRFKDKGKTFIIPDIGKIGSLFDKFKLRRVLEEYATKPIFIEYDDSVSPLFSTFFTTDIPREGMLIHLFHPPGVYVARYYYKDGHPVFLQQIRPDESGFGFSNNIDPYPFYKKTNYLYKKDISKDETVSVSDKWNISASVPNGYRKLDDESLHRLLEVGKKIASNDWAKPFKITIEYQGDSSDIE